MSLAALSCSLALLSSIPSTFSACPSAGITGTQCPKRLPILLIGLLSLDGRCELDVLQAFLSPQVLHRCSSRMQPATFSYQSMILAHSRGARNLRGYYPDPLRALLCSGSSFLSFRPLVDLYLTAVLHLYVRVPPHHECNRHRQAEGVPTTRRTIAEKANGDSHL